MLLLQFESGIQEDAPKANTLFLEAMVEVAIRAKVSDINAKGVTRNRCDYCIVLV